MKKLSSIVIASIAASALVVGSGGAMMASASAETAQGSNATVLAQSEPQLNRQNPEGIERDRDLRQIDPNRVDPGGADQGDTGSAGSDQGTQGSLPDRRQVPGRDGTEATVPPGRSVPDLKDENKSDESKESDEPEPNDESEEPSPGSSEPSDPSESGKPPTSGGKIPPTCTTPSDGTSPSCPPGSSTTPKPPAKVVWRPFGLPVTGIQAAGIIAAAVVLLGGGALALRASRKKS